MSDWLKTEQPCPCGKSSDAYAINKNGWGKCFSCDKNYPPGGTQPVNESVNKTYDYYEHRNLTKRTLEFYNVMTEFHDGEPYQVGFIYPNEAVKFRLLNEKKFLSQGPMSQATLFGKDKFEAGSRQTVIITEGEYDAMSAYQMIGREVAVVSIRSSSSAFNDCDKERDYLNSFDRIVLCLDNDEQGKKAASKISSLFDYQKVYRMAFEKKDASEYLQAGEVDTFRELYKKAKRYTPSSIVNRFSDIRDLLKENQTEQVGEYPFSELNTKTYGLHKGDMILLKALEGRGKTEVCRAILHHNLKNTKTKLATIFLEESESTTVKGVATYELGLPCTLPDSGVSDDDIMDAYSKALDGEEDRLYIHKHFSSEDEGEMIDNIRFLVASAGCNVVFLDNLTMLTTGREGEDERLRIDRITRRLRDLVNELGFCLILVAHVNDDGLTRGSRLPDKLSNTVIFMDRNVKAADENERRTTSFMLEKVRLGGQTGPAGKAVFDTETYKLRDMEPADSVRLI